MNARKLKSCLKLMRPHQWVKNVFILAPLVFGYRIWDLEAVSAACLAFAAFSCMASAVYIFNDLRDVDEDRHHPEKRHRPLASGELNPGQAIVCLGLLLGASLFISLTFLSPDFLVILSCYLGLNLLYSLYLKHVGLLDIACIAIGFDLRVFSGGAATGVPLSQWLIIMTFLLALFMALAKRRDDLLLASRGNKVRRSIAGYNLEFVSAAMMIMAAVTIVSYILYTVSPEVIQKHQTANLYLTTFWVILGLMRYMQITLVMQKSGSPTRILLKDAFLQIVLFLWLLNFCVLLYVAGH